MRNCLRRLELELHGPKHGLKFRPRSSAHAIHMCTLTHLKGDGEGLVRQVACCWPLPAPPGAP
eukprot:2856329-Alexandrium_andersonii.AAC.1